MTRCSFAAGLYLVGELIPISASRITLLRHPDGTTLRGCDPDEYDRFVEQELAATDEAGMWAAVNQCGMLSRVEAYRRRLTEVRKELDGRSGR